LEKPHKRFLDRANPGGFMDPDIPSARGITGPTGVLRLSEGCSHPCSFCVIPGLRGGVQSRPAETILREARELAAQGVEEFSVIAQDTGDWGREWQGSEQKAESRLRLPRLLRSV